ncbi:RHS repeat domain-containing protein [Chitinophaga sp. Hz27]|uniref:RHS repeat domain-containing protein n=1 Tax=Chitinophaga sp. Hz27 TaxID=3347169 RepID=UPI0035DB3098
MFITQHSFSQTKSIIITRTLDGAKRQLQKDSVVSVQDSLYFDANLKSKLDNAYKVRNIITFKLNEYSTRALPVKFTAALNVRIIYTTPTLTVDSTDKELTLNYDTAHPYILRRSFIFENAHAVTVKVLSYKTDANKNILPALILENAMEVTPAFKMDAMTTSLSGIHATSIDPSNADELPVSWPVIFGANAYDLEWAYVDSSAIDAQRYGNPINPDKIFENNATRVTVASNSYGIPLMYDHEGALYFRFRPVQEKTGNGRITGNWSTQYTGGLGSFAFTGHERQLNWQAQTSFAEEGKRKTVLNYFDGSLRGRQTVTKDNTTNTIAVGENIYDYQGRAALKVLPAPTLNTIIKYTRRLNTDINGAEYTPDKFDYLNQPSDILTQHAPAMGTGSGTAQYYSPNNPQRDSGFNKFIPDAEGYVFSETAYTMDNTNRPRQQGAAGKQYILNSGHDISFTYGTPSQEDLYALFGTEVGDASHYFKNTVTDANGQVSVSYLDMHGRTIATALAGHPKDTSLLPLDSVQVETYRDVITDGKPANTQDRNLVAQRSFTVAQDGYYDFNYTLKPPVLKMKNCAGDTISYIGAFDLLLRLTDDLNNARLGGSAIEKTARNYDPQDLRKETISGDTINANIHLYLTKGSYTISKVLTVNQQVLNYYRDSIFLNSNVCVSVEHLVDSALTVLKKSSCDPQCADCDNPSRTDYDDIRDLMLSDMSAPYGQYANVTDSSSPYSIFYSDQKRNISAAYKTSSFVYKDANGDISKIYTPAGDTLKATDLDPVQFSDNFQDSWAVTLLSKHPEYDRLNRFSLYRSSLLWEKNFNNTDTYAQAKDLGYLAPASVNNDTLLRNNNDKNTLQNKLTNYQKIEYKVGTATNSRIASQNVSMFAMAVITTMCQDKSNDCVVKYMNYTPTTVEQVFCPGDRNMIWRTFRGMYANEHRQLLLSKAINDNGSTNKNLLANNKHPQFTTNNDLLSMGGIATNQIPAAGTKPESAAGAYANNLANQEKARNLDSMANIWLTQLSPCVYYDATAKATIKRNLMAVAGSAQDGMHPYGASTIAPNTPPVNGFRSFEDVINKYNADHGITDKLNCNADLITFPKAYELQRSQVTVYTYQKPKDCECSNLTMMRSEYAAAKKTQDTTLSAYIKRTRGVTIAQSDLDAMYAACTGGTACTYLETQIKVPGLLQCNIAPPCVSCTTVNKLYNGFKDAYKLTPVYEDSTDNLHQINQIFANYMNNRTGFSKTAQAYLAFIDSCAKGLTSNPVQVCVPGAPSSQQQIYSYNNTGSDSITAVKELPDGFLLAGSTTGRSMGAEDGYLIRTNKNGVLQWAKNYGSAGRDVFRHVALLGDSAYVAIGSTTSYCYDNGAIMIVCTDTSGTIIWNKAIDFGPFNGGIGNRVVVTSSGNIAFAGARTTNGVATDWVTGVISAEGEVKWVKQQAIGGTISSVGLIERDDTLYLAAAVPKGGGTYPTVIRQLVTTGQNIDAVTYNTTAAASNNFDIIRTPLGYSLSGEFGGSGGVINLTAGSSSATMQVMQSAAGRAAGSWQAGATGDGSIIGGQSNGDVWLHRMYSDSVLWSNHIQLPANERINNIIQRRNASFAAVGMTGNSAMLIMTNGSGKTGCNDVAASMSYSASTVNPGAIDTASLGVVTYLGSWNVNDLGIGERFNIVSASPLSCPGIDTCYFTYNGLLCGNTNPIFEEAGEPLTKCSDSLILADLKGNEIFNYRKDSVLNTFEQSYVSKAMEAATQEELAMQYENSEYQYTLYYYDQAGNLVKTVPPAGVVKNRTAGWINQVKAAVANGNTLMPQHSLTTNYRYNTLNTVVVKKSPDGGVSNFWYDPLGRPLIVQNSQQKLDGNYSYTIYDEIGRVTEVGQINTGTPISDNISRSQILLTSWLTAPSASRTQITRTVYDKPYLFTDAINWTPDNLRNRVAWSAVYNNIADTLPGKHVSATYYSYDIHGNVRSLLQDYRSNMKDSANIFKRINYDYDLISEKINMVSYQPGQKDAFYHRYSYDAENRITNVETSRDSIYWENDAYYQYYRHGVLARAILGQAQVQGVDYAYTLQGWLKGVNSSTLGASQDMGKDGSVSGLTARDAFSYSLHYNNNDYTNISGSTAIANLNVGRPLYNGNIAIMGVNLPKVGEPLLYSYTYDVLNRIKAMNTFRGLDTVANKWIPVSINDFAESISYDNNGNILKYNRNGNKNLAGAGPDMDGLSYHYISGTNKLDYISDTVSGDNYDNDLDNQSNGNYTYDAMGNVIGDIDGKIKKISWTIYGKMAEIEKLDGTKIKYAYDVTGNRVSKSIGDIETRYVRDATGNVISVYVTGDPFINHGQMSQTETHLYGSSRLGINNWITNMMATDTINSYPMPGLGTGHFSNFQRGYKFFELSNHVDNSLATIGDDKLSITSNDSTISYFIPRIKSMQDYAPFGMGLTGRSYNASSYRYGFNGKENDNEVKGIGNQQDYGMRIYDPRIGKFLSVDPLTKDYPWYTPYQFAGNTPIQAIDIDGAEPAYVADKSRNDGKVHLKLPVIAMFAKLYGEAFWLSGARANIKIDQSIHDKITKYQSGAITLGYEMIFTENYGRASAESWLKLLAHEKVHVQQFILMFGKNLNEEEYKNAVKSWIVKYGIDAAGAFIGGMGKSKDDMHDDIDIEREANSFEAKFKRFYDGERFERKRKVNGQISTLYDNRVLNLLKAMEDAKNKIENTTDDKIKAKQQKRYEANFKTLLKLVDKFNEKENGQQNNNGQQSNRSAG